MTALRNFLRRLDRIVLGPTLAEIEISRKRPTIFSSDRLPAFYKDVQSEFGIEFSAREMKMTDNMDDLMALVRRKYLSKHQEDLNPHGVWGTLKKLEEMYLNSGQ